MDFDLGMVGLGTMGRNLLLNFAGHGFNVAGYDLNSKQIAALEDAAHSQSSSGWGAVRGLSSLADLISALRKPRAVMLLVPAGKPVDAVIAELLPLLQPGDLIIDGGNSHYVDTDRRARMLGEHRIEFLGVGISGGETGARLGPSMMPGGSQKAYQRVRPIFEAAAAKVKGEPCVAYLGPGSAGHYVKTVHNGIEYGLMELIAESYDLLKRGLGFDPDELYKIYKAWNEGELESYLIEITAHIFAHKDPTSGKPLVDLILGEARQKGTGMWTSQDAMELQVPTPNTDAAVAVRNLSTYTSERAAAHKLFQGPNKDISTKPETFIAQLRSGLYAAMLITYAQGMALLRKASAAYGYELDLETIARIWRGGCIIRAAALEDFRKAFSRDPGLANLLLDTQIADQVNPRSDDLRAVVHTAASTGLPAPGFMAALAYLDGYRSVWLPTNLIQAQRDYFGAHTYARNDKEGVFHTQWGPPEAKEAATAPEKE